MTHHFDLFALPDSLQEYQKNNGTCYQWKRLLLHGELETTHQSRLLEDGWRPVPLSRHPESGLAATGDQIGLDWVPEEIATFYKDCIVRGGMVLMEHSQEAEDRARELEHLAAQSQLVSQYEKYGIPKTGEQIALVRIPSIPESPWSCRDWIKFKFWVLLWLVGVPVSVLLTPREQDVARRSYPTLDWKKSLQQYAVNKAALIAEGRL